MLPAATDWLVGFGSAHQLVGRTHLCDAPEAAHARIVTSSSTDTGAMAPAIDDAIRCAVQSGLSPFVLDLGALQDLQPDLIVTQTVCGVCAPPLSDVTHALATLTNSTPEIIDFAPGTHKQVLDAALGLANRIGRFEAGMQAVAESEQRLRKLASRVGGRRQLEAAPTVVCIEWVEPPMTAGHWTPDLVEHAGGKPLLSKAGERSRYVSWDEVDEANPDVLVVAACGRSVSQSIVDLLRCASSWRTLRAVRSGRAFVLDGDRLFNRPGPLLTRSAEVLAWAIGGDGSGVSVDVDEAASFPRVTVAAAPGAA
ncbi:MAG: ABC transporter substrate-binding protein [Rubricoccaceae bacterium]